MRPPKPNTPPDSPRFFGRYFRFYDDILVNPAISLTDAAVFSLLTSLQRGKSASCPTQDYLAARLKISKRSVIRSIKTLEQQGFISVLRTRIDTEQSHNTYSVTGYLLAQLRANGGTMARRTITHLRKNHPKTSVPSPKNRTTEDSDRE